MNKIQIFITFVVIIFFVAIIIVTQSGTTNKSITQVPTLPPDASTFKLLPTDQQGQAGQQQVQGAQTQQTQAQTGQQASTTTYGVQEPMKATYSATIKTTRGIIELTLNTTHAPNTVKNFITKATSGFYNGLIFHRVEDWVIQGGDPKGDGTGGGLMQTEINSDPFVAGSLGVARGQDINVSNDSQFFITKTDSEHLNQQYTNFGSVASGMDVVSKIQIGDKIISITVDK